MVNYLTTSTASATYATIASLSAYGAKATTNTWDLLQSFTIGVQTQSIVANTTTTDVSLFTTNTAGTVGINSTTGTVRCGGARFNNSTTTLQINNQLGNGDIYIGNEQSNAFLYLGAGGGTRTGTVILGRDGCPLTVNGAPTFSATATATFNNGLTLGANKFITTTTTGTNSSPTANQIGYILPTASNTFNTTVPTSATNATSIVRGVSLTSGVWIIIAGFQLGALGNTTQVEWGITTLLLTNAPVSTSFTTSAITYQTKSTGIQNAQQFETIGFYQNATASAVPIYVNLALTYTTAPTIATSTYGYMRAIKIA
jgi:hypothetical protein